MDTSGGMYSTHIDKYRNKYFRDEHKSSSPKNNFCTNQDFATKSWICCSRSWPIVAVDKDYSHECASVSSFVEHETISGKTVKRNEDYSTQILKVIDSVYTTQCVNEKHLSRKKTCNLQVFIAEPERDKSSSIQVKLEKPCKERKYTLQSP